MRNKTLMSLMLAAAVGVIGLAYYVWPERRDVAVRRHLLAMESAWQTNAPDHVKTFVHHRDELVRLGHLQIRSFVIPMELSATEKEEVGSALAERAQSRPLCEWSPGLIKVFASAEQMPGWETTLARWNIVRQPEGQDSP